MTKPGFAAVLMSMAAFAHAQSVEQFGVNKSFDVIQTDASTQSHAQSAFYAFVEGTGLSPSFPSGPISVVPASGSGNGVQALSFQAIDQRYRYDATFGTEAALSAAFSNGLYTIVNGADRYELRLTGSHPASPLASFSRGSWKDGHLVLSAEDAANGIQITGTGAAVNGFRSIEIESATDPLNYFEYDTGGLPTVVSRSVAGGIFKPGHDYVVAVEFDQVVDAISPAHGELRAQGPNPNGFAVFSSATRVSVSVVPEPSGYAYLAGMAAMAPLIGWGRCRRKRLGGQRR